MWLQIKTSIFAESIMLLMRSTSSSENGRLAASMACLLVQDKVCVVGNAPLSGVAVELASVSIQGTYQVDIGFDFDRAKHVPSKDHNTTRIAFSTLGIDVHVNFSKVNAYCFPYSYVLLKVLP